MADPDPIVEHAQSSHNREALHAARLAGCFYCLAIYPPAQILDWVDWPDGQEDDLDTGRTALCARCGIDSVIPLRPGIDTAFLRRMHDHWFSARKP